MSRDTFRREKCPHLTLFFLRSEIIQFLFFLFSHCTARRSSYPYMYTLQLHFFSPPFVLLQHEYLDKVLNATSRISL